MTDSHGIPWSVEDGMDLADFVKKYRKKKKKTHEQQDEDDRKRREVSDVADDDTSRKRDKSVTLYETTSKAWHEGYAPPAAKAIPKLTVWNDHEGPPPKKAMPNPSPKKVDASSVAATGSVSKAAVASSAQLSPAVLLLQSTIDTRQSVWRKQLAPEVLQLPPAVLPPAVLLPAVMVLQSAIDNRQSTIDNRQSTAVVVKLGELHVKILQCGMKS